MIPPLAGALLLAPAQDETVLWRFELASNSNGSGAIDDIDRDGKPEVVFGTYFNDERLLALNGEDGSLLWEHAAEGSPFDASVAIADLDRDGGLEILAADSARGLLRCLDGAGKLLWTIQLASGTDSPPAIADLEGDGKSEIVVGAMWGRSGKGSVAAYGSQPSAGQGARAPRWSAEIPGCVQSEPCLVDLDGDRALDVVVTSWRGDRGVHALSGKTGTPLWTAVVDGDEKSMGMYHGVSVARASGALRIVLGTYDTPEKGQALCLDAQGAVQWKKDLGELAFAPTTVLDADGDGDDEMLVGGQTLRLFAVRDGKELWNRDLGELVDRGAAVADADGDGDPDFVVAAGRRVLALDAKSGQETWAFSAPGEDPFEKISSAPLVADLDGDGLLEVFFVLGRGYSGEGEYAPSKNRGTAYAVRTTKGKGPGWTTFRGNLRRDGRAETTHARPR